MSGDDDLELNGLDRFSKRSPRLTLEVHSHCEVPAGCGGVVLRWIDRSETMPMLLRLHLDGAGGLTIDGEEPISSRPLIRYGRHVLGIELEGRGFMFAALRDESEHPGSHPERAIESLAFRSEPDGSWRFTDVPPAGDDWARDGFDDSSWRALGTAEIDAPRSDWSLAQLVQTGAVSLGIGSSKRRIWVRRIFEVRRA